WPTAAGMHAVLRMRFSSFFFQAEDGIRAFHVTGVQTCALPICREGLQARRRGARRDVPAGRTGRAPRLAEAPAAVRVEHRHAARSEERRVGKEWRARRTRDHE